MKTEKPKKLIRWYMSVMSQSSTNSAIIVWCIAAAVYEKKYFAHLAG